MLTAKGFYESDEVKLIGDVHFLSYQHLPAEERVDGWIEKIKTTDWWLRLCLSYRLDAKATSNQLSLQYLDVAYENFLISNKTEPTWINLIPMEIRRYLRQRAAVACHSIEPWTIMPWLPFAGFGYVIAEGGITEEISRAFGQGRLRQVAQLGFLHPPVISSGEVHAYAATYSHNRLIHSCDVRLLLMLMIDNNQEALRGMNLALLEIAGQAHDTLTPAGGDSTKRIDPEAFDEDAHFGELFAFPGWAEIRAKYFIDEDLLLATIANQGIFGQLLDLADKLAYTSRDVHAFLEYSGLGSAVDLLFPRECRLIRTLVQNDPLICGLWDSVRVEGDNVYIEDVGRLRRFLTLRALMFRVLYYNPSCRFLEDVAAKYLIGYLYQQKKLTRDILLRIGDDQLKYIVAKETGVSLLSSFIGEHGQPRIFRFISWAQAVAYEQTLTEEHPNAITVVSEVVAASTAAVRKFSVKVDGKIVPFAEGYPESAERIVRLMNSKERVYLYALLNTPEPFPPPVIRQIKEEREKRWQSNAVPSLTP